MAVVFRSYFEEVTTAALTGRADDRVNCQVPYGPTMGAFKRFAENTPSADRHKRHVDTVAESLMTEATSS
ncbi:hypothetical protein [Sinosporangium siamense]|uniref:hypothetical protein n=1 Tax=Sinosporangium siamense TaxID=1367973 RepID=UPI0019515F66|nr:hypothetical protein [Sinosporangium siamense]